MRKLGKYYAVRRGRVPGIYYTWKDAQQQIDNFPGARFKSFYSYEQASQYVQTKDKWITVSDTSYADVLIYTDGGCRHLAKLGAYAFLIINQKTGERFSGKRAVPEVTNHQMELMALLSALRHFNQYQDKQVVVVTDSRYTMQTFVSGWIESWYKNNWVKADGQPVKNVGLMEALYNTISQFKSVNFKWVKGHANNSGNNRVDLLVNQAMDEYLRRWLCI